MTIVRFPLLHNKFPQNLAAENNCFVLFTIVWVSNSGRAQLGGSHSSHSYTLAAVRRQLGLQSSRGSTELDVQSGSQHIASNWCWLLARHLAGAGDQSTYSGFFNKAVSRYPGSLHGRWLSPEQAPQENQAEAVWLFKHIFGSHTASFL